MHLGNAFRDFRQQRNYICGDIFPTEKRIPVDLLVSGVFIIDEHEISVGQF